MHYCIPFSKGCPTVRSYFYLYIVLDASGSCSLAIIFCAFEKFANLLNPFPSMNYCIKASDSQNNCVWPFPFDWHHFWPAALMHGLIRACKIH